jgi:hypothetical protein
MNFRYIWFLSLMAAFVFLSPGRADEFGSEFWPTVRRVLRNLRMDGGPSFARAAGPDGLNWRAVSGSFTRDAGVQGRTVNQLLQMLDKKNGNIIIGAAQRDRRVELGLSRHERPGSPLLVYIEKMETERQLFFANALQLGTSNNLHLSQNVLRAFIHGNFAGRTKFAIVLEENQCQIETSVEFPRRAEESP